jgi:hypothetical protein
MFQFHAILAAVILIDVDGREHHLSEYDGAVAAHDLTAATG